MKLKFHRPDSRSVFVATGVLLAAVLYDIFAACTGIQLPGVSVMQAFMLGGVLALALLFSCFTPKQDYISFLLGAVLVSCCIIMAGTSLRLSGVLAPEFLESVIAYSVGLLLGFATLYLIELVAGRIFGHR